MTTSQQRHKAPLTIKESIVAASTKADELIKLLHSIGWSLYLEHNYAHHRTLTISAELVETAKNIMWHEVPTGIPSDDDFTI